MSIEKSEENMQVLSSWTYKRYIFNAQD